MKPQSLLLAIFACGLASAQNFEVASVRPAAGGNFNRSGGPGTADPGRFILENYNLGSLITTAYGIPGYLLAGPDWIDYRGPKFNVDAKVPAGTTPEQFLIMLQHMLAERFRLTTHREKKEMSMYELSAGSGVKLKPASTVIDTPSDAPYKFKTDADGFPVPPPGQTSYAIMNNRARLVAAAENMEHFIGTLSGQLRMPVVDATGLTGKYDFTLTWIAGNQPAGDAAGPNLQEALRQQLGLVLREKKGPIEILVVDHAEQTPVEN